MSKIWVTSDLHFCHAQPFVYEWRGFDSVEAMNSSLVRNWNELVADEDECYILGDIMLNDNEGGLELLKALKGKIHIIIGNHDSDARIELYRQAGFDVAFGARFRYKKYNFFLSHYPTITDNDDADKPWSRVYNLHGHTHQFCNFSTFSCMYHVGVDSHCNKPVDMEEILSDIKTRFKEIQTNES